MYRLLISGALIAIAYHTEWNFLMYPVAILTFFFNMPASLDAYFIILAVVFMALLCVTGVFYAYTSTAIYDGVTSVATGAAIFNAVTGTYLTHVHKRRKNDRHYY